MKTLKQYYTQIFKESDHEQRKWDLLVIGFYAFLFFFLPTVTFDWGSFVNWSEQIRQTGFNHIYQYHYVNYMPLNLFAIQLWQISAAGMGRGLVEMVQFIKIYPMIFDCLTIMLLFRFAKRYNASLLTVLLLFLPNLAFQYNSFIFGQFDGVYTFFVLLSSYFILRKQPVLAFLAFVFALNSKIQAVVFWPSLLVFVWLYIFQSVKDGWKRFFWASGVSTLIGLGIQILLFLPFSATSPLYILSHVWSRSASLSHYVTYNANNFWILIGVKTVQTVDLEPWLLGINYYVWGYILLAVLTLVTFLPLMLLFLNDSFPRALNMVHLRLTKLSDLSERSKAELLSLVLYIQGLGFFFFLTQMHERYSHPAVVFSGLFALLSRRKKIFLLTCAAYLINLEQVAQFWKSSFDINQISLISRLSALCYLMGLALALVELYRLYLDHVKQETRV